MFAIQELNWIFEKKKKVKKRYERKKSLTNTDWVTFVQKLLPITVGRTWADAVIRTPCMILNSHTWTVPFTLIHVHALEQGWVRQTYTKWQRRMDGFRWKYGRNEEITFTHQYMDNVHALMGVYTGSCISVALMPFYTWSN